MKKFSFLFLAVFFISCASQSDKMQAEYFKDFQTQVLSLSQRVELLEAKLKKDLTTGNLVYEKLEKLDERVLEIEKSVDKIKKHPLFESLDSVKLTPVPSTTVITIKPESVTKTEEAEKPVSEKKEQDKKAEEVVEKKEVVSVVPVPEPKKADTPAVELYNKGYEMYNAGKFPQAISIFREFLQKYSKDALADNAQYWIAESYYAQKMFDKAINEFKKVESYHDRNKVPDAYLKIVYAYREMGKKKEADKWKEMLIKKFKDSEAAKKVQEKSTH